MMAVLEGHPVLSLVTGTSENNLNAIRFLQRYGFRQSTRDPIASLDVAGFDAAPFAGIWERIAPPGHSGAAIDPGGPAFSGLAAPHLGAGLGIEAGSAFHCAIGVLAF